MSIIITNYKDRIDKCWYDSSNVLCSQCNDNKDGFKDLQVVFKDGRTYLYKDVNVNDYILFKHDISQGKALNKYILKKYKGVRLTDTDINSLNEEKEKILKENSQEKNKDDTNEETNTIYHINDYDDHIELFQKDKLIYKSLKNEINIIEVLRVLGIKCTSKHQ